MMTKNEGENDKDEEDDRRMENTLMILLKILPVTMT